MNGNATYNLNNLQTFNPVTKTGINLNVINHTDAPEAVGDVIALANASDSFAPTNEHISKLIRLAGTVHGSTQADLDSRIDALKGIFTRRGKDLDISYGGGVRRYNVIKANAVGIERQNKALFASFSIELICKPFGKDVTPTTLASATGVTTTPNTYNFTVEGTAPYQLPIITITINAVTGATGAYLQVSNDLNGQEIIISGVTFAAGDVVVINPEERSVTVDGNEVDYNGAFIELEAGDNAITVSDGFTTRNIDTLVEYRKRYL